MSINRYDASCQCRRLRFVPVIDMLTPTVPTKSIALDSLDAAKGRAMSCEVQDISFAVFDFCSEIVKKAWVTLGDNTMSADTNSKAEGPGLRDQLKAIF